jgi:hypothetical protein
VQNKDYNALAAEMMDWTVSTEIDPKNPDWHVFKNKNGGIITNHLQDDHLFLPEWNPIQDRNQAYMLLKRVEEFGLWRTLTERLLEDLSFDYVIRDRFFWDFLTCPSDIITIACVDVYLSEVKKK